MISRIIMKKYFKIYTCLLTLVFFSHFSYAQNAFEGIIHLSAQNEERNEKASVSWMVSNGNHRLDFDTQTKEGNFKYSLVYKAGQGEAILLTPGTEKNFYYRVPVSGFPKTTSIPSGAQVTPEPGSKLISGVECKQFSFRSGENSATAWVGNLPGFGANDIPEFLKTNGILGALTTNSISGIPLEFVIFNSNHEILSSQNIVGITRQTVQHSIFEIPAGYEAGN